MPILIADSNFLQKSALREYLIASRSNRIALAEEVLVEMHKREPALSVQKSLEIARSYPAQVVVIRGVTSFYGFQIRSAADVRRLIDKRQTAGFAQWYDDVLKTGNHYPMAGLLADAQQRARAQIEEVAATVQHIQPIFRKLRKRFDDDEVEQLQKSIPYSPNTQRKLLDIMYEISRALFVKANVPKHHYPQMMPDAFSYFVFRYAMCMTLLYTRWVQNGNLSDDTNKLVNHVFDMHLAALGTFFGGVLSNDKMLLDVHREARWLLRMTHQAFVG